MQAFFSRNAHVAFFEKKPKRHSTPNIKMFDFRPQTKQSKSMSKLSNGMLYELDFLSVYCFQT